MDEMQVLRGCKDGSLDAELEVGPGDAGKSDKSKKKSSCFRLESNQRFCHLALRAPTRPTLSPRTDQVPRTLVD
jgi:hypothetical protein